MGCTHKHSSLRLTRDLKLELRECLPFLIGQYSQWQAQRSASSCCMCVPVVRVLECHVCWGTHTLGAGSQGLFVVVGFWWRYSHTTSVSSVFQGSRVEQRIQHWLGLFASLFLLLFLLWYLFRDLISPFLPPQPIQPHYTPVQNN